MWRRAFGALAVLGFAISCRNVLGIGDPLPYEDPRASETPAVTEDNSACGADLVVDPDHCGYCGHSCRGSRCERGKCVPVGLLNVDSPVFAVFDGRVFASSKQNLIRLETNGQAFIVADKAVVGPPPRAMIANRNHLVWSGDEGVHVCSTTGCPSDGPEILSAAGKKTGPVARVDAVHPTLPYLWANFTDFTVERYKGTTPLSSDTRVEGALCPASFAEVDGGAYLSDAPGKRVWLYRGTENGRIVGTTDEECAFAAGGNYVFYTDTDNVWRSEIMADGSLAPRTALATNVIAPKVLAADDEFVYWAGSTPETAIVRCPITGCEGAPEIVVDAIPAIDRLVLDGPFVYFSVYLNATLGRLIYRVAK